MAGRQIKHEADTGYDQQVNNHNKKLSDKMLHLYMEKIAESGCSDVNKLILDFEAGATIREIAHLDKSQQQQVMRELKKVMQVYDSCEIDPS